MSERQEGWYWVKQESDSPWEIARLSKENFENIEAFWAVVGDRIPTPDEPWQTVPVRLTHRMDLAGTDAIVRGRFAYIVYADMLAEAPKP